MTHASKMTGGVRLWARTIGATIVLLLPVSLCWSDEPAGRVVVEGDIGNSRNWTTTSSTGTQHFEGTYVGITGFDSPNSKKYVLVDLADGRRRGFVFKQLSAADQAFVRSLPVATQSRPATGVPLVTYKSHWNEYDPVADKNKLNTHATKHFLFYWGKTTTSEAKDWLKPAFREMNYQYFERVWDFYEKVLHAPMPYAKNAVKFKTNVYITGTGLAKHPEGFASGDIDITINPTAMEEGSFIVPHEFGHTVQHHTDAFSNEDDFWFWETHSQWIAHQMVPAFPEDLDVYTERAHYALEPARMSYLNWPYVEYGSWPFMEYLSEDPRFGPQFCWDIWTKSHREKKGAARETPLQTIMRLGVERKIFQGNGVEGFGDLMGQVAAHNVAWDYTYQTTYRNYVNSLFDEENRYSWERTALHGVPDRAGWFKPLYSQAPHSYGYNIVDLKRVEGAQKVTVNLQGIGDETEGAGWRATIVATDETGKARYSPMWHTGEGSLDLQEGDTSLSLAIVAAPSTYKPPLFEAQDARASYNLKRRWPYEVSFEGCVPFSQAPHAPSYPKLVGKRHPNGGGFVAWSAHVDSSAYVAPGARVIGRAQVKGHARIEDFSIVADTALVGGNAIVGGHSIVRGNAQVLDNARVRDFALVEDRARVNGTARVLEYVRVHGYGIIGGNAFIKGFGDVRTSARAPFGGTTFMTDDLEVDSSELKQPINYGLVYGSNDAAELGYERRDFGSLTAHWDFNRASHQLLKDAFADNDGVLRGGATFARSGGRDVLTLNGDKQYALIEGSAVDCRDIQFDVRLKWNGGEPSQQSENRQHVFGFGSQQNTLEFTPQDSTGKAAFLLKRGANVQVLHANKSLPRNVWTHLTIALSGDTAIMSFNNTEVARSEKMTLNPEDVQATWGCIGTSLSGGNSFNGEIDDFSIYRSASPGALPAKVH